MELLQSDARFCVPLEVTFYGERAQDYGGPRKEFLGTVCREIRDRLFQQSLPPQQGYELVYNPYHAIRDHYRAAGMALG